MCLNKVDHHHHTADARVVGRILPAIQVCHQVALSLLASSSCIKSGEKESGQKVSRINSPATVNANTSNGLIYINLTKKNEVFRYS